MVEQQSPPPPAQRRSLCVLVPAYGGVDATCVLSIHKLQAAAQRESLQVHVAFVSHNSFIPDVRNRLLREFLKSGATHALMVDSDVAFEADTVLRMLALDRDFIVGAVPIRGVRWDLVEQARAVGLAPLETFSTMYNVTLPDAERLHIDGQGTIETVFAGVAFALVKREVVTRMVEAYPELVYDFDGEPIPGLFHPIIENRKLFGEDYSFCKRWRDIGGKIWLLADAPVCHTGPAAFRGNFASQFAGAEAASGDESERRSS